MLKHTLTAAALAAVLATAAFAQKQSAPGPALSAHDIAATGAAAQPAGFMQSQDANELRGAKLIGASVYGPDNKSIGAVNDVLIDKDGRVTAVVVGVGGFLGVGEKNVALPFQALKVERKQGESTMGKIAVSYSKDQLKNAPRFAYYKGGAAATTGKAEESARTPVTPNAADTAKAK